MLFIKRELLFHFCEYLKGMEWGNRTEFVVDINGAGK